MHILTRDEIIRRLDTQSSSQLHIDPILDRESQMGEVSIDLRLGYDFYVSVLTRNPTIDVVSTSNGGYGIPTHFQSTRRDIGDKFILYPGQVVLGTTLEYLALPANILAEIGVRSSYARLGMSLNSFAQPGYRGCVSLEIFNHGNIPIDLVVGSRVVQARLYEISTETEYLTRDRKYHAVVRPTLSKANQDPEIEKLMKYCRLH